MDASARRQQMESGERLEQFHRVAHPQFRMLMAVAECHHLREKLDIHQTAVALLDIEPRLVLGADLHLHPLPHRRYFADLSRA